MSTPNSLDLAVWCLVGKAHVLVKRISSGALDRAAWTLPVLPGAACARADVDALVDAAGLNSVRRPLIELGEVLLGAHGGALRMAALSVEEPEAKLKGGYELLPLALANGAKAGSGQRERVIVDALVWSAAHLYFSRPESAGRPRDFEIFGSVSIQCLRDDYFNHWFPDASRDFQTLGLNMDLDLEEGQQPSLRIQGRAALLDSEIYNVQARLVDLGRHSRMGFWVTQIVDGQESVQDFADPATGRKLMPRTMAD